MASRWLQLLKCFYGDHFVDHIVASSQLKRIQVETVTLYKLDVSEI